MYLFPNNDKTIGDEGFEDFVFTAKKKKQKKKNSNSYRRSIQIIFTVNHTQSDVQ